MTSEERIAEQVEIANRLRDALNKLIVEWGKVDGGNAAIACVFLAVQILDQGEPKSDVGDLLASICKTAWTSWAKAKEVLRGRNADLN